jgi:hypothetical protein
MPTALANIEKVHPPKKRDPSNAQELINTVPLISSYFLLLLPFFRA